MSFHNATRLGTAVKDTIRLLGKEWYEPVSVEEIAAIKAAMVSGPRGFATHSGHWYKCQNGHPVGFSHALRVCLAYADWERSLRLGSVGRRWRRRGVRSVGPLLEGSIMYMLRGSLLRRRWSKRSWVVVEASFWPKGRRAAVVDRGTALGFPGYRSVVDTSQHRG